MKHFAFLLPLALFSASLGAHQACGQTSDKKTAASEEAPNVSLSREIHHQILVLPFYSVFDSIKFSLDGHKVTLTGQVLRRNLKEHAEAAIKSIEGVDAVVNQIEVLPPSPSDDDLRDAVYRALYEDSTLARYAIQNIPPVHIIVKNGMVTLEGSIDSVSDKTLAATRAGSVTNVSAVKNNLVVRPPGGTPE
jgi:hyperosmotically inducible periplasmic protein